MKLKKPLFLLLVSILVFFPILAFAAPSLFDPSSGDKSIEILRKMFGGLFGGGEDPFAAGIKVFNGAVLIIGGILVAYTILAGTLATAHDGQMLGKRFSSMWVPIRTALGTALILPVVNGTYCTIQLIVAWIITQGVGLADKVWEAYGQKESLTALATSNLQQDVDARAFGYNIFRSQVCVAAINKAIEEIKSSGGEEILRDGMKAEVRSSVHKTLSGGTEDRYQFGVFEADGNVYINCGNASIPQTPGAVDAVMPKGLLKALTSIKDAQGRAKAITSAQNSAAKTMISTMGSLANSLVNGGSVSPSAIDAAIMNYQRAVKDAAANQIQSMSEFKHLGENMTQDGWLLAGAFYVKMAYLVDLIHRSASNLGSASGPRISLVTSSVYGDIISKYEKQLNNVLNQTENYSVKKGFSLEAEANPNMNKDMGWIDAVKAIFSDESNISFEALLRKAFVDVPEFFVNDGEHPLMAMKRLGNTILTFVAGVIAATAIVMAIGGPIVLAAVLFLKSFVWAIIGPLIAVGIVLSYILPMLPFFIWFGAVIGWVVLCIEAILAAPMWAAMHLNPYGADLVGSASQGYRLVLSLMLRPALMIFGLITAFVMLNVIGGLYNQIFFDVFVLNQQDSGIFILLVGFLASLIIYAIGLYILIKKLLNMIYIIPDEMLKWFGGGGTQLGNFANTVGGEHGGMAAGAAILGYKTEQAAGNLSNVMRGKFAQIDANNKNFIAETNKNAQILENSGANIGSILSDKGDSYKNLRAKNNFSKKMLRAINLLGGVESGHGQKLVDIFNDLNNDNNDLDKANDNLNKAIKEVITDVFGKNTNDFLSIFGGANTKTDLSGKTTVDYNFDNPGGFTKLSSAYSKLIKAGYSPEETTEKLNNIIKASLEEGNGDKKQISQAFKKHLYNELKSSPYQQTSKDFVAFNKNNNSQPNDSRSSKTFINQDDDLQPNNQFGETDQNDDWQFNNPFNDSKMNE